MIEQILHRYEDIEIIKADGFNDAIIGIDCENVRLVYSISKALDILKKHMDHEEPAEFFEFHSEFRLYVTKKVVRFAYYN
tara:strand:- start:1390 stop:1629 length:240 start_codon:yes stop_codon:yes gene_type:complete